jgi:hypothetical protein
MGAYDNDPRVVRYVTHLRVDDSERQPHQTWPVMVKPHPRDGWAIYELDNRDAYKVAGFRTGDDALRFLIGEPR